MAVVFQTRADIQTFLHVDEVHLVTHTVFVQLDPPRVLSRTQGDYHTEDKIVCNAVVFRGGVVAWRTLALRLLSSPIDTDLLCSAVNKS